MKKFSKIQESLFSEIVARGEGRAVRKEDDVDFLDGDSFCDYLKDHYDMTDPKGDFNYIKQINSLEISIMRPDKYVLFGIGIQYEDGVIYEIHLPSGIKGKCPKELDFLRDKFKIYDDDSFRCIITNKSGDVSNHLVIEILDDIIEHEPVRTVLKKRVK